MAGLPLQWLGFVYVSMGERRLFRMIIVKLR